MAQIDNFIHTSIAFYRPIKRTFYILRWDSNIRRWRKYCDEDHEVPTVHRSDSLPPATCKIYIKNGRNTYNITVRANGLFLKMDGENIPIVERTVGQIKQSSIGTEYTTRELADQTQYIQNIDLWRTVTNTVVDNDTPDTPTETNDNTNMAAVLTAMRQFIDNNVETELNLTRTNISHLVITDERLTQIAHNYIVQSLDSQQNLRPIPQRVAKLLVEEAVRNNEMCAIDLTPLTLQQSAVTSCFHVFSEPVLTEWFQRNQPRVSCPVCREICVMTKVGEA